MKKLLVGLMLIVPVGLVAKKKCKVKRITQADVDAGFTTSGSGRYILCEDITFGTDGDAAITLADDNVQLFLMNHSIELTSPGATGIRIKKADDLTITEVLVDNDAIENNTPTTSQTGTGIEINKAQKVALLNICTMQNNIGLKVTDSCDVYVHKCSFIEAVENDDPAGGFGCQVTGTSSFTFDQCVFKDNTTNLKIDGASKDGKIFKCTFPNSLSTSLLVNQIQGLLIKNTLFTYEADNEALSTGIVELSGSTENPVRNVRFECSTITNKRDGDVLLLDCTEVSGLIINSCLFDPAAGDGSNNRTIDLTTVNSFEIRGSTLNGQPDSSGATFNIEATTCTNGYILNNLMQGSDNGVNLVSSTGITIHANTICSSGLNGVRIASSSHNVVSDNHICKNGRDDSDSFGGVFMSEESTFNVVKNNAVSENTKAGIRVEGNSNTIVNNDVLGNTTDGIELIGGDPPSSENLVQRNRVHNNITAGIDDAGMSNKVLSNVASKNPAAATNYIGVVSATPGTTPTLTGQNISSSP